MHEAAPQKPQAPPGLLFIFRCREPELFGGIPRKILIIAERLKRDGLFSPALLTTPAAAKFSRAFAALGLPVHHTKMAGRGALRRTRKTAEALLQQHDVVLVQTHRFWGSIVGRALRKRHPRLRHLFRVHTHIDGSTISWPRRRLYHLLDRCTAKHVDSFCSLSVAVRDELIRESHVPSSKVRVVRNGIPPLGPVPPMTTGDRPIPARFVVVGEIERRKRQDLAIRALKALEDRGVRANLTLVGGESEGYGGELRRIAVDLGVQDQVAFRGYTDDVYGAIKDIEVVILPSDFEGIPTSIVEAMSLKKLVIATPAGATGELIRDNDNGLLMPADDMRALASILHRVFASPAEEWIAIRESGYDTWRTDFSVDAMMADLRDEYRQLGVLQKEPVMQT